MLKNKKTLLGAITCASMGLGLLSGLSLLTKPSEMQAAEATHTHTEYSSWDTTDSLPSAGKYYLSKDVTLGSNWTINGKEIELCLNDHVINLGEHNIRLTNNAKLTLNNCGTTERYFTVEESGLWKLSSSKTSSTKTIKGGYITGGKAQFGGAVNVNNSTFIMNGGTLVGNRTTVDDPENYKAKGGAVFVTGSTSSFTLNGGSICGNTSLNGGSAVTAVSKSTFTMTGGEISDHFNPSYGANVSIEGSSFTMSGGKIANGSSEQGAAGVYVTSVSSFTMTKGEISGNTTPRYGGNVYVVNSTFKMSGGKIAKGSAALGGGGIYADSSTIEISGGEISENTALSKNGGGVYSTKAVSFVMSGGEITKNTAKNGANVYSKVTFKMTGGKITNGVATDSAGGVYVNDGCTFIMAGGEISGNEAVNGGGILNEGTLNLGGGDISKNKATEGAGICNISSMKMSKGNIKENIATENGGGIVISTKCSAEITGGTISLNQAKMGGGIGCAGSLKMSNVKILKNTASKAGGGVYATGEGSFILGGVAQVTNNVVGGTITEGVLTGGTANNFCLAANTFITIGTGTESDGNGVAAPGSTFLIGVSSEGGKEVKITTNGTSTDAKYFVSDSSNFLVSYNTSYYLQLESSLLPDPIFNPSSGYASSVSITTTSGTLYYTINGTTPTASSTKYTGPILVNSSNFVIKVIAISGQKKSNVVTGIFTNVAKFTITNGTTDANGSITVSKEALAGDTVEVTIAPNLGYKLGTLKYNDGTDHQITANKEGKYLFTMPKSNVTVVAEFEQATIGSVLPNGFPTVVGDDHPDNCWLSESKAKLMLDGNNLYITNESDADYIVADINSHLLVKDGDNLKYTNNGFSITFVMSDGVVTKIKFEGLTGSCASLNGTYGPHVHSIQETHSKVEPSCLHEGHEAYYECSCGKYFSDQDLTQEITDLSTWLAIEGGGYIAPLGHEFGGEVSYTWNNKQCTASWHCDHDGCEEVESETVTGVYVKDSDATTESNEKGHYEATFTNANFAKQVTAANSVEKEGTKLLPEPVEEKGLSAGAIVGIVVGSVVLAVLVAYIAMFFYWKKNEKALKFLIPSFKWINKTIFKK